MQTVSVDDTCIACGTCVEICPEVFELEGDIASVKSGADLSLDAKIIEAAEECPVEAIHHEK
jgi:ferredoxin